MVENTRPQVVRSVPPIHPVTTPANTVEPARYGPVLIALHWLIGAALIAEIVFGFLLDDIAPRGTPERAGVINLHKSIGMVLGLAVLVRLGFRLARPVPPFPATMAPWKRRAAALNHRLMYVCMVVQPLSGYLGSNFSKYGVKFFGTAWPAWGPESPAIYAAFNNLHVGSSWLFALLIVGHTMIALKHGLVDRDGIFARILPPGLTR